jgi:uncharacterized protein YecT (DUF1311 family)
MKTLLIVIIVLCFYLPSRAQVDLKNPPWETGCDPLETQIEMNICSSEKLHIADSILNLYYNKLANHINSKLKDAIKDPKSTSDKYNRECVKQLKQQRQAILQSKYSFLNLRKSISAFIGYQYEGGTMKPLQMNTYALDLTVNQIKILDTLLNEIARH